MMNKYEQLISMSLDDFARWLDINGKFEGSPWMLWFTNKYCENCEPIKCRYPEGTHEFNCSYCELENKCKFFPAMEETPDNRDMIEMWLKEAV